MCPVQKQWAVEGSLNKFEKRKNQPKPKRAANAQWDAASQWYDKSVGEEGHYYHQNIILPSILKWVESTGPVKSLVDLGCGQGVLQRHLPVEMSYLGVDASLPLLRSARNRSGNARARYLRVDLTKPWADAKSCASSHATLVLALQNMPNGSQVLQNAFECLHENGQLLLVLNHPCFRIPRQSSWHLDPVQKTQMRCIHTYLTPLEIPISTHPSKDASEKGKPIQTWSYHHPLSTYVQWLADIGFVITSMQEWASDKVSTGKWARTENRARGEIPLFLALQAVKKSSF